MKKLLLVFALCAFCFIMVNDNWPVILLAISIVSFNFVINNWEVISLVTFTSMFIYIGLTSENES